MSRLAWLVKLYPPAWRARYGEEFLALLEQQPVSLYEILNILLGILDARLHRGAAQNNLTAMERMRIMFEKLQKICSGGLVAFLFFVLPCAFFNAMLDDSPFGPAMRGTQALGLPYHAFVLGCLVAGLAVLAGGFVVLYGVFRWAARQKRRDIQLRLLAPTAAFVLLVAAVYVLNWSFQSALPGWLRGSINQCCGALFLFVSVACIRSALNRAKAADRKTLLLGREVEPYRLAALAAPFAAAGMAVAAVSAVVWGFMAAAYAPEMLKNSSLGIFQANTQITYVILAAVMLLSACISCVMAARGAKYLDKKAQ